MTARFTPTQPTTGQVFVRSLATEFLAAARLHALEACLRPDERERANRFVRADDRREWIVARGLLRELTSEHLGESPESIDFAPDARGRPYLVVRGARMPNLDVTLSHTRGLAACGLGVFCRVGIDAEKIDERSHADLVPMFFAPAEAAWLARQPASAARDSFLRIWTLKEAVVKAEGSGLGFDFASFAVLPDPPRLHVAAPSLGPCATWRLAQWRPTERHIVSLACRGGAGVTIGVQQLNM